MYGYCIYTNCLVTSLPCHGRTHQTLSIRILCGEFKGAGDFKGDFKWGINRELVWHMWFFTGRKIDWDIDILRLTQDHKHHRQSKTFLAYFWWFCFFGKVPKYWMCVIWWSIDPNNIWSYVGTCWNPFFSFLLDPFLIKTLVCYYFLGLVHSTQNTKSTNSTFQSWAWY